MTTVLQSENKSYYVGVDKHRWWKEAVVYQIYPASFLDLNGDGWGDVPGITKKLDYLEHLGFDVLWLSPIYKSPQEDMGYDISDYTAIDALYGDLSDVDTLIKSLQSRNMKLVMDLVVNHTSDQHAWFQSSRSSKTSPNRDWYIWKPARYSVDGTRHPPNNWAQILGEANSAWTWDEQSQEYYLSLFTPSQPDLNWENPAVRKAVHDILRFWLDRGVSGFRMDVINLISKHQDYPDAPITVPEHTYQPGDKFYANGPRLYEYLQEMNSEILSKYDTLTVGEMPFVRDEDEIIRVVGADRRELNMIFAFDIVDIDNVPGDFKLASVHPWDSRDLKRIVTRLQRLMIERDGWNTLFIENHDQPRSVSRYTDDSAEWREYGAKLLCLMQVSLSGTLFVYQGEELGMRNVPVEWDVSEYKDVESMNYWKKINEMYPNDTSKLNHARHVLQRKARDNARTPVQWNAEAHAGFTRPDSEPWMRVNDDFKTVNAEAQVNNADSVLTFWKNALKIRKDDKEVFVYGDYAVLDPEHPKVVAWKRWSESKSWVFLGNFSGEEVSWDGLEKDGVKVEEWVVGNYKGNLNGKRKEGKITLWPWEGLLGTVAG